MFHTLVFLVLLVSGTDKPTLVMMAGFQTATECNEILAKVPKESKYKWACIKVDVTPQDEEKSI